MARKKINIKRVDGVVQSYHVGSEAEGIASPVTPADAVNPYLNTSGEGPDLDSLYSKFSVKQNSAPVDSFMTVSQVGEGSYHAGNASIGSMYGLVEPNGEGFNASVLTSFSNGDGDVIVSRNFATLPEALQFMESETRPRLEELKNFNDSWEDGSINVEDLNIEAVIEHEGSWDNKVYAKEGLGSNLAYVSGFHREAKVFHDDDESFLVEVNSHNKNETIHLVSFDSFDKAYGFAIKNAAAFDFDGLWKD